MPRFAISWSIDARLHVFGLEPTMATEYIVGRESGVGIVVPLPTVSRRQARLTWDGSQFQLENLSATNATRLDGQILTAASAVADGARIEAGNAILGFHDLATGDRISGPVCSFCRRENKSGDPECWFCGTSLVNAITGVRTKRRLLLRLVDTAGLRSDLVEGQTMRPRTDGGWDAIEQDAMISGAETLAPIIIEYGRPVATGASDVAVQDARGVDRAPGMIETGDVLVVGDRRYVAITR